MRMHSRLTVILLGAVLLAGVLTSAGEAVPRYVPGVLIVKLRPDVAAAVGRTKGATVTGVPSVDALNVRFKATAFRRTVPAAEKAPLGIDRHGLTDYYTIELPPGTDIEMAVAEYAADPNIEVAEPDYIMPMDAITPNDPMYNQQWTHYQTTDRDIDTPEAWDLETGDSTIIVGITDSGMLYDHEDLIASMWVNPGEDLDGDGAVWDTDDMNGVDDDGNGFVDDLVGWDFYPGGASCWPGEDCDGPDNNPRDFTGHGSFVGGIVAATTDNGIGVAGVAGGMRSQGRPGVKLMAIRVGYLDNDGKGYVIMSACANGFNYAVANGASVLNASWGTSGSVIQTAAQNALDAGLVVTKSAGNDNDELSDALAAVPDVIVVAALNNVNKKASFSSYGTWVDISAPGENILSTYGQFGVEGYASLDGTSFAAPIVAGVAALLKTHHPWFTHDEIDTLLLNHTDDVYADNLPTYIGKLGTGRVNAYNSLSVLTTADFDADTAFGHTPWLVNFTDVSPNAPSGPYYYDFGDGGEATTADAAHTYTEPGIFTVSFTASGPSGPHTRVEPDLVVVVEDTVEYESILLPGAFGSKAAVPVRLRNTHPMDDIYIPFRFTGTPAIFIDSLTLGSRIPGWSINLVYDNRFSGQIAWRLSSNANPPLEAGEGVIAYLWVRSGNGNDPGEVETVDSARYSSHYLHLKSEWVDFIPDFVSGTITIYNPCSCPFQGDFDEDLFVTGIDLSRLIDVLYAGSPDLKDPSCPSPRADFDCDGYSTSIDLALMIDYLYAGGPGPCDPCAP